MASTIRLHNNDLRLPRVVENLDWKVYALSVRFVASDKSQFRNLIYSQTLDSSTTAQYESDEAREMRSGYICIVSAARPDCLSTNNYNRGYSRNYCVFFFLLPLRCGAQRSLTPSCF